MSHQTRRNFLAFLASLPGLGYFIPAEKKAQATGLTLPDDLPAHFPRNLVVIVKGIARPVPVVVVDDIYKFPDQHFKHISQDNKIVFTIELPLVTVSKDGKTIIVFCYLYDDFCQITEQLMNHYSNLESVVQNLNTSTSLGHGILHIFKWQIKLLD